MSEERLNTPRHLAVDEAFVGMPLDEPSLLASLDHPAIPRALEVGRTPEGRWYLSRARCRNPWLNWRR